MLVIRFLLIIGIIILYTSKSDESINHVNTSYIQIYHLIDNELWGQIDGSYLKGIFDCNNTKCEIISTDVDNTIGNISSINNVMDILSRKFAYNMNRLDHNMTSKPLTVGLYNIHSYKAIANKPYKPDKCRLNTHLNIAESEESFGRFGHLFHQSFHHYDGNSTTHPDSSVQRTYINVFELLKRLPLKLHKDLIKGAAYVASTCHKSRAYNREDVVKQLRESEIRVDSLGKCGRLASNNDGVTLHQGNTALESLLLKQTALNNYMFYLAFENTIEPGYVTEKVLDGLIAGSVPVYYGSSTDCKKLLHVPKGIIYLDDFNGDVKRLSDYLKYLIANASAYEEHRYWRDSFSLNDFPQILLKSWPCRLCEWAQQVGRSRSELRTVTSASHC